MDPLGAYRMTVMPGLMPKGMPIASPEDTIAKIIPKGELDQLSSSALIPNSTAHSVGPSGGAGGSVFQSFLGEMVKEVSAKQAQAGEAMQSVMAGGNVSLHKAMIAAEEASVSFRLMVEVRNKLLESYQELMRMQV